MFRLLDRRLLTCLSIALAFAGGGCVARAQDTKDLRHATLTGDWGGLRQSLADDGIDIEGEYLGEFGSNISGGRSTGIAYAQQVLFGVKWDLDQLLGWSGATLHSAVIDRVGDPLSLYHTGSSLEQDYIYGSGENARISELDIEQKLAGDRIDIKAGYVLMGLEFASTVGFCDDGLINNAFCAHPQYLGADSGYQLGPVPQLGARLKWSFSKTVYLEGGAFQYNPRHLLSSNGFDLKTDGDAGTMYPVELGFTPKFAGGQLPGHYKFGGLYETTSSADIRDAQRTRKGRYVLWLLADQMVYRPDPANEQGLTLFGEVGVGDRRTSSEPVWVGAGAFYQGALPGRPEDTISLAWAHAEANSRGFADPASLAEAREAIFSGYATAEDDIELSYHVTITPWLTVTPDFQYVRNPGAPGFNTYPDAKVLSLQSIVTF